MFHSVALHKVIMKHHMEKYWTQSKSVQSVRSQAIYGMTPLFLPISMKASRHLSMSSRLCVADSCTLMRASPEGLRDGGRRVCEQVNEEGKEGKEEVTDL